MISYTSAIILGLLQGLMEFFPVSSSGHLVLARTFFGIKENGLAIDIALHAGTLFSVLCYYQKDLKNLWKTRTTSASQSLMKNLVVGIFPAALAGFLYADTLETWFGDPHKVLLCLSVTGVILFSTRFVRSGHTSPVTFTKALWIGLCQVAALLPGISRSGTTISAGMHLKLAGRDAADFSFFMFIPLITGAIVLKYKVFLSLSFNESAILLTGVLTAFISGLAAIHLVRILVTREKFHYFAWYCWAISLLGFTLLK
jgi:undecaprenyl-diphosphatase